MTSSQLQKCIESVVFWSIVAILLFLMFCTPAHAQTSTAISPYPRPQFLSPSAVPLAGGSLKTYAAGTTTPLATYADYLGVTQNTVTITLDSGGFPEASGGGPTNIFLGPYTYKFCAFDATSVQQWCVDGVADIGQLLKANLAASSGSSLVGFLQAGANALTTETTQDKLRQIVSAADFAGSDMGQKINRAMAACACDVSVPLGTYIYSTPIVMLPDRSLVGSGWDGTILQYSPASGIAIDFNQANYANVRNVQLTTSAGATTATGIRLLTSYHNTFDGVLVNGFATNWKLTGTGVSATTRTFDTRIVNSQSTNFTTAGIAIDHAVDTYITNVLDWGVTGNPTTAWALIMDTGTSGLYADTLSILNAGVKIQNSAPSAVAFDMPPEFFFGTNVISDTVAGTDAILLDASLSVPDAATRKGKSYRCVDCWGAFTQTTGTSGLKIAGGEDISFSGRFRVNSLHGINITGGDRVRISDFSVLGNNLENNAAGCGIRVAAGVSNFQITNGVADNFVAGEPGHQKYGVCVNAGVSAGYTIAEVEASFNDTGGIFDAGTGAHITCNNVGTTDNGGGLVATDYCRNLTASYRHEMGDGNFYDEFNKTFANDPVRAFDANDYIHYSRTSNYWDFIIGGNQAARISATTLLAPNGITSGSGANTDLAGQLTLAAGTNAYTFVNTYITAPVCVATDTAATPVAVQVNTTTTTLTLTVPGGANTDTFNYLCVGRT